MAAWMIFFQFYRVYMGTADEVDDRLRARGATVSMYGEALGTADNGDGQKQKDVYVENEELKEGERTTNRESRFRPFLRHFCMVNLLPN